MKKTLSRICAWALAFVFCFGAAAAFAAETATPTEKPDSTWRERARDRIDEAGQVLGEFRTSVREIRETVKSGRSENVALVKGIRAMRKEIVAKLKAMKESDAELSPEITEQLKAYKAQLQELAQALRATQGDIRKTLGIDIDNWKTLDFETLESHFAENIEVQNERGDLLAQINAILISILALLE